MSILIAGTGSYLPARIVTNAEIEATATDFDRARAGSSLDDWARRHHGGVTRHHVAPGEATSDMAIEAARRALLAAGLAAIEPDLIVMATISNDYRLPQAAGMVQAGLGSRAKFVQLDSACSGFVDAVLVAHALMMTQSLDIALVVCADALTSFNDPTKFLPMTVFGDGAGAVVLRRDDRLEECGIRSFSTGSDGELGEYVWIPGGGSKLPLSQEVLDGGLQYWRFDFPRISRWAVERMVHCTREAVAAAGIALDEVQWVVPHQASTRIVLDVARRLGLPEERFVLTYPHTGNTSAASIPIALDEAVRRRAFAHGDWLVMPAVGAGMAWGAFTYRWHGPATAAVAAAPPDLDWHDRP